MRSNDYHVNTAAGASRAAANTACVLVVAAIAFLVACALRSHGATIICYGRLHYDGTNGGSGTQVSQSLPCYGADNVTPIPPGCHFTGDHYCKRRTYNPDGLWYGYCDNSVHGDPTQEYCNDHIVASTLTTSHAQTFSCSDGRKRCVASCTDYATDPPENVNVNEPTLDYFNADTLDICDEGA